MNNVRAFTLLELSIVLVVIGLIVAAVISGTEIVKAGKVRAQISQFKKYELAFNAFRSQYDAIPGDFPDAANYWSAAFAGNGDLRIDHTGDTCGGSCGGGATQEKVAFFSHLSYAGLIPEQLVYAALFTVDVTVPRISFDNSGNYFFTAASRYYHSTSFGMDVANPKATTEGVFIFARSGNGTSPFNPPDLQKIDAKMDDGFPSSGLLWGTWNNSCSTGTTPVVYRTDYTKGPANYGCGAQYVLSK